MFFFHDLYEMIQYFYEYLFECLCWFDRDDNIDIIHDTITNPITNMNGNNINPNQFESHQVYQCQETF